MALENALYLIILIEGYVVLAAELLAIRQVLPFVGNGIETIAIIVAAVLMPLAIGYYIGGKQDNRPSLTIRAKLTKNILTASLILPFALSYPILQILFSFFDSIGIKDKVVQTIIYSTSLVAYPIFLLGQTIPLISNYFSGRKLSRIAGKMLFFSTLGSFLGSIISTLILMSFFGVNNTVIITISLLSLLYFILSKRNSTHLLLIVLSLLLLFAFNNNDIMKSLGVIENNNYSTIKIASLKNDDSKILIINNSFSSQYSPSLEKRFDYIQYVERTFLKKAAEKKSILIIGAGGFTIGINDDYNQYVFVDIDKSLKRISENFFLKKKLGKNKIFVGEPARVFLRQNKEKYDFIFVDAYSNIESIPSDLITEEFFLQVKDAVKVNGTAAINVIAYPDFQDSYSIKIDNSLRTVFGNINREILGDYDGLSRNNYKHNVIYSYFKNGEEKGVYTDNKNAHFLDRK